MRHMSDDGIDKVNQGITGVDELLRVIYMREEEAESSCPNCGESVRREFPTAPIADMRRRTDARVAGGKESRLAVLPAMREKIPVRGGRERPGLFRRIR